MARLYQAAVAAVIVAFFGATTCSGFYLPGVRPVDYSLGAPVELKVKELTSTEDLAYAYYSVPFCTPPSGVEDATENLGEYLQGTTIENSGYIVNMLENTTCNILCVKEYNAGEVNLFIARIRESYHVHWLLDNLPSAYGVPENAYYADGFPLGEVFTEAGQPESVILNNHHHMIVQYHQTPDGFRVVGFYVAPVSVKHVISGSGSQAELDTCQGGLLPDFERPAAPMYLEVPTSDSDKLQVVWTYDVEWVASDTLWSSRWDVYLSMGGHTNDDIHWFSIINSFVIVLFLSGMVAMILTRALYRDFSRYNRVATDEEKAEDREETGWKLVHADVFRPPATRPMLFCIVAGVGSQVFMMTVSTVVFAAIGFLSPANRGSLMIALVLLFLFMGIVAGYVSARTHKSFNGKQWQRCTLGTAVMFPCLIFFVVLFLNLFVWIEGSSTAIPFGSMFVVFSLWLLLSVPLVFAGAYFGYKKPKYELPVRVGAVPRPVPTQPWYLQLPYAMLVGGILCFSSVFVEMFFIMTSLWSSVYYYVFGFLLLSLIILIATCAEIAIVLCYFQLCAEDYRWWWRSVAIPGAAGIFCFIYSIFHYVANLSMSPVAAMLYFGYNMLISVFFFLFCGAVGYYACFTFVRRIYAAIRVD